MKPLYEISNKYKFFVDQAMQCDELTSEQLSLLEDLQDNLEEKAIQIASFIRNLEVEQQAIDDATDKMANRMMKLERKVSTLKTYLKENLEKCGIKEVKSSYFDIRVKNNPASIVILDELKIPDKYIKTLISKKIDKELISSDLKENMEIPGISVERKTRLDIR